MNSPVVPQSANDARAALHETLQRQRRSARWHALEYLFWCLPVLAYFLFPGNYLLLSQIAITSLFALSLDLIFGYAGIISLGHAAFFGVGAYTVGLLGLRGMGDPLTGLLLAALFAAVLGFLSSFLVLRGSDLARLMVTLGVALMLYELANKFTRITGGVDGIPGIEIKPILGLFEFDMYGRVGYVYAVVVLFVLFWIARRIVHSPFGQSLRGIQMNAQRMPALGVPVHRRLVAVYTLGAAYAGVAGAVLAQTNQFVSLSVLGFENSADLLLILILGGTGRLYGGLIGAIVFIVAKHLLSDINPQYWQFWLGLALVLLVMFARGGILGTAAQWLRARRQRTQQRSQEGAA
ncbi:branched-chain amino acid ABC transporter permease [Comamonas flocculans]|uniref:Branched-chain amino acid ABC transporter permease n=1 Tax=Comamonas flocculans TaxID=2597701 RepID=A0A5B8RVC7_9BURK|nr:branched-chain amino acid ABC transporter permease [Comamonas flocculans]QEA13073.1 branched-chain amino acid ABC transporter permease [Comamonas flocculans]